MPVAAKPSGFSSTICSTMPDDATKTVFGVSSGSFPFRTSCLVEASTPERPFFVREMNIFIGASRPLSCFQLVIVPA